MGLGLGCDYLDVHEAAHLRLPQCRRSPRGTDDGKSGRFGLSPTTAYAISTCG